MLDDNSCICAPGYTDKNCSTNINECLPDPCENGGNYTDLVDNYSCTCVPDYTDKNCSTDINECSMDLCQNGGNCRGGFSLNSTTKLSGKY